jgi:hypothetical protein
MIWIQLQMRTDYVFSKAEKAFSIVSGFQMERKYIEILSYLIHEWTEMKPSDILCSHIRYFNSDD